MVQLERSERGEIKNENTAMSEQVKVGGKLKLRLWDQASKSSSRGLRKAMIVHVLYGCLTSSYPIRRVFSNISAEEFPSNLS